MTGGGDGGAGTGEHPGRCPTGTTRARTRTMRCCAASTSSWPSTSTRGSTTSPLIRKKKQGILCGPHTRRCGAVGRRCTLVAAILGEQATWHYIRGVDSHAGGSVF